MSVAPFQLFLIVGAFSILLVLLIDLRTLGRINEPPRRPRVSKKAKDRVAAMHDKELERRYEHGRDQDPRVRRGRGH